MLVMLYVRLSEALDTDMQCKMQLIPEDDLHLSGCT